MTLKSLLAILLEMKTRWYAEDISETTLSVFVFVGMACIGTTGCCPDKQDISAQDLATVSEVLDSVKGELSAYLASEPGVKPMAGICNDGSSRRELVLSKASLKLNTIAIPTSKSGHDATFQVGVIGVGQRNSGQYSPSQIQTLEVEFDVSKLHLTTRPVSLVNHQIADSIAQFRDQLLMVDHNKIPCLKSSPNNSPKMSLSFDVIRKPAAGAGVKLETFNPESQLGEPNVPRQSLNIEFSLSASPTSPKPPAKEPQRQSCKCVVQSEQVREAPIKSSVRGELVEP